MKIRYLIVALLLVTAACSGGSSSSSTSDPGASTTTSATTVPGAPATTFGGTQATGTTLAAGVDPDAAAALRATLDVLVAETEEVRGLSFLAPPNIAIVTPEQLARQVLAEFLAEDETDYAVENALFTMLGAMDAGTDLESTLLALLAEQVLGYYDGETGELVVGASGSELSAADSLTVVHELVHALTDQHFDFYSRFEALLDADHFDEAAALQALLEGDATYFELVYFQDKMTPEQQVAVATEVLNVDMTRFDASPAFLRADLEFPYIDGFFFVETIVDRGGTAALDDVYENPPTTTEHILHPPRYLDNEGEVVLSLPPTPLPGYTIYEEDEWGEWGLHLLFAGHEDAGLITQLGDGWGGDRYRVLSDGTDVAFVLLYQADRESDAFELAEALLRLAEEPMELGRGVASGGGRLFETTDGYAFLDRVGDVLVFIAATDPADGAALREMVPVP